MSLRTAKVLNADSVRSSMAYQRRMSLRTALTDYRTVARYEKEAACAVKKHYCCRGESGSKKDLYVKNDMMKQIYVS